MPENQTVLFGGLILGLLRILLFQGRAESPGLEKERIFEENWNGRVYYYEDSRPIRIFLSKSANI